MNGITMRDNRKTLELSSEQIAELINNFEKISKKQFDDKFADIISNMIGILREKYLIEGHHIKNRKIRQEIIGLQNTAKKFVKSFQNKISTETELQLLHAAQEGDDMHHNLSSKAVNVLSEFTLLCDVALKNLKNRDKNKDSTFYTVRDDLAVDLARELHRYGVKITKYEDGHFAKCLRVFYEAFSGKTDRYKFQMYIPENIYVLIQNAANNYKTQDEFFLLKLT